MNNPLDVLRNGISSIRAKIDYIHENIHLIKSILETDRLTDAEKVAILEPIALRLNDKILEFYK